MYTAEFAQEQRDGATSAAAAIESAILPTKFLAAEIGHALSAACLLRSATLIRQTLKLATDGRVDGSAVLLRTAFESIVTSVWLLAGPTNVARLYADHQRTGRQLITAAAGAGEIDRATADDALEALQTEVPDQQLPNVKSMIEVVSQWLKREAGGALPSFADSYRRVYRPLSALEAHGFSAPERYLAWSDGLEQVGFRSVAAPFLFADEAAFLLGGFLLEVGAVVLPRIGIEASFTVVSSALGDVASRTLDLRIEALKDARGAGGP